MHLQRSHCKLETVPGCLIGWKPLVSPTVSRDPTKWRSCPSAQASSSVQWAHAPPPGCLRCHSPCVCLMWFTHAVLVSGPGGGQTLEARGRTGHGSLCFDHRACRLRVRLMCDPPWTLVTSPLRSTEDTHISPPSLLTVLNSRPKDTAVSWACVPHGSSSVNKAQHTFCSHPVSLVQSWAPPPQMLSKPGHQP